MLGKSTVLYKSKNKNKNAWDTEQAAHSMHNGGFMGKEKGTNSTKFL